MARTGSFRCSKCGRTFSMAAHLARHMSAGHGAGGRGRKKKRRGRVGRPPGSLNKSTIAGRGRKKGSRGSRFMLGLQSLSIETLTDIIEAAREEARRKLDQWQKAFR